MGIGGTTTWASAILCIRPHINPNSRMLEVDPTVTNVEGEADCSEFLHSILIPAELHAELGHLNRQFKAYTSGSRGGQGIACTMTQEVERSRRRFNGGCLKAMNHANIDATMKFVQTWRSRCKISLAFTNPQWWVLQLRSRNCVLWSSPC